VNCKINYRSCGCDVNFYGLFGHYRSEANDLALQIADTVTGNTEHICVEGYESITLPFCHILPPRAYHGNLKSLLQMSTYKKTPMGPHSIVVWSFFYDYLYKSFCDDFISNFFPCFVRKCI